MTSLALFGTACADEDEPADARSSPASDSGEGDKSDGEESTDGSSSSEECEEGPDRVVTPIDEVTIPAFHEDEFVVDDTQAGDVTIPGFTVPAIDIPEHTIDTGCIIEYKAPGGCFGGVEISGFEIPGAEIPGYEIPEVTGPDGEMLFDGVTVEGDSVDSVAVEGQGVEETCQEKPAEGDTYIDSVYRDSVYRDSGYRDSLYRDSGYRDQICVGDVCADSVSVPSVSVESVSVESVSVESKSLPAQSLGDSDASVIEDDETTAYIAPADVLFEFDKSDLNPNAVPTLQAIVDSINTDFGGDATITVEGHTDNKGEPDYNQTLSEQRAEAVKQWLTDEGGLSADQISSKGYGETLPVTPNENSDGSDNPEARAKNRRVVITVTPAS